METRETERMVRDRLAGGSWASRAAWPVTDCRRWDRAWAGWLKRPDAVAAASPDGGPV